MAQFDPQAKYALISFKQYFFSEDENILVAAGERLIFPSEFTSWLAELKKPFSPSEFIARKSAEFSLLPEVSEKFMKFVHSLIEKRMLQQTDFRVLSEISIAKSDLDFATITADRPDALQKCLSTYLENAISNGHTPAVTLIDNSRSSEARDRNRKILLQEVGLRKLKGYYIGGPEKKRMAADLSAASEIPVEVVQYGMFGAGYSDFRAGANRNTLALFSAGSRVICVDDDTECQLVKLPNTKEESVVSSDFRIKVERFRNRGEGMEYVLPAAETDFFGAHGRVLGYGVREILGVSPGARIDSLPELPTGYKYPENFEVRTTLTGVFGDSGTSQPLIPRGADDPVLKLASDFTDLERFMYSRQAIKAPELLSLTNSAFFQTIAVGLDYRVLLPPFVPEFRHEDDMFAELYRGLFRNRLHGFLPFAVTHNPPEKRMFEPGYIGNSASQYYFSTPFLLFFRSALGGALNADPEVALVQIGQRLQGMGSIDAETFENVLLELGLSAISQEFEQIERFLSDEKIPGHWRQCLTEIIEGQRNFVRNHDLFEVADLKKEFSAPERVQAFIETFRSYGNFLQAWPRLFNSAKKLSSHWRECFEVESSR